MGETASAFVTLIPSAKGFGPAIQREMGPQLTAAGKSGGASIGGGLKSGLLGPAAVIGAAVGAILMKGVGGALESGRLSAQLGAQLGLTKNDAAKYGKIAGEVFSDGYGGSLGDVNTAIRGVFQNVGEGNDAWVEDITGDVLTISQVFEQDLGGVTKAVGQLMRTGLAKDSEEALDIVTKGFQLGTDKSGDFLDTLNEYGTQFRKLGINGGQATALLGQGLQAGARDADIVADSLKEFSIRAIDGSKTTAQGFAALGLSGKKMSADIAKGGPTASAALALTLDKLRAIKDPADQSAAAVALFGTQSEDMGAALLALDLNSPTGQMSNFSGATEKLAATVGETASAKIDVFKRKVGAELTGAMAGAITTITGLGATLGPIWGQVSAAIAPVIKTIVANVGPVLRGLRDVIIGQVVPSFREFVSAMKPIFEFIVKKLAPVVGPVFRGISAVIKGALQVIGGIFRTVAALITGDWSKLWSGLKQILSGAWSVIKGIVSAGWAVVKSVFSLGVGGIVSIAKTIGSRIKSAVGDLGGLLADAGRAVADGFLNGLKAGWGKVTSVVNDLVGKIPKEVRSILGIASPSKVFREIGQQSGEGLRLGLLDGQDSVLAASTRILSLPTGPTFSGAAGSSAQTTTSGPLVSIGTINARDDEDVARQMLRRTRDALDAFALSGAYA